MRQLAPGVYDDDGTLHLDLSAMLEAAGYADTPQNRDTLERSAVDLAAELGIPVEPATPAPIQGDAGIACPCGGRMLYKNPSRPTADSVACPRCGRTPLDLVAKR